MAKVFNDPVHGHIQLHPLMVKFIDTHQFQRLRYIKQLGGAYYVFPGASHNCFEHSIGVGYLAGELVETLKRNQRELDITDTDVLCVKLAGLCHDLGHGPFSHLFDRKFIPRVLPESKWKHEEASLMLLDHLIKDNDLDMEDEGLDQNDIIFIKELIIGPIQSCPVEKSYQNYYSRRETKNFLYEIVANNRTGIDVDKWDYFARDCYHLGIPNSFDLRRYMKFVRVIKVNEEWQICCRDKEVTNLYEMFHTRSILHRKAYQHKTTNIIEEMIVEALVAANEHLKIPGINEHGELNMKKMSEAIDDPVAYTGLTDQVLQQIQLSSGLENAKSIIKKIEKRKLHKFVGWTALSPEKHKDLFEKKMCDLCKDIISKKEPNSQLSEDDIIIQIVKFDYGKKAENPINQMHFYRKDSPDKAYKIPREQVSYMLPIFFMEKQIRVLCKENKLDIFDAVWKCFQKWCHENRCTFVPYQELDDR